MTITFALTRADDLEMDQHVLISLQESNIMVMLPAAGTGRVHHVLAPALESPAFGEEEPTWEDAEWQ